MKTTTSKLLVITHSHERAHSEHYGVLATNVFIPYSLLLYGAAVANTP